MKTELNVLKAEKEKLEASGLCLGLDAGPVATGRDSSRVSTIQGFINWDKPIAENG